MLSDLNVVDYLDMDMNRMHRRCTIQRGETRVRSFLYATAARGHDYDYDYLRRSSGVGTEGGMLSLKRVRSFRWR